MPATTTTSRERLPALDGLRGLAALVVLLSHVVGATVAALGTEDVPGVRPLSGAWAVLAASPVAILWEGPGVVTVFFVLSAFVLTRAALTAVDVGRWRPLTYLTARAIRLYLPVWAAVAAGTLLALLVARPAAVAAANPMLAPFTWPFSARDVLDCLTLWTPTPAVAVDGALWSLHWEVLFSLLLPAVVLVAPVLRRHAWLLVLAAIVVLGSARTGTATTFMAPFAVGVALALHEDAVLARRGARGVLLLAPVAVVLLTAPRWLPGATHDAGRGGVLAMAGAACAVLAPLLHPATARVLTGRAAQWLGRRSYSLYVIHMPIVGTLAFALGTPSFGVLAVVAIPASLAAAAVVHRLVERPAQRLARAAGARHATTAAPPRPVELAASST